jgi:hypothetical protein
MSLRHVFPPAVAFFHRARPFTTSRALLGDDDGRNHYETLNVHPGASPAEIKKSAVPIAPQKIYSKLC